MRIQVIEQSTNKPLASMKLKLQVKGKENSFLSLNTDDQGFLELDDTLQGEQISVSSEGKAENFITATDGAKLKLETKTEEKLG